MARGFLDAAACKGMNARLDPARAFARQYAFPLILFAVLRVWTLVWASVVAAFVMPSAEATKHYYGIEPLRDAVYAPWQRWDTIWYSKIASQGYAADERAVFAPFYPFLMRLTGLFTRQDMVAAGLLISSVAALVSFILLYRLARELFGEGSARRTLIFLAAFPTAFYLFAVYTESLFLALALGAFLCARKKYWTGAGLLGGLAGLTRPQGILFLVPLTVEFLAQFRQGEIHLRHAWGLLLVALGGIGHFLWLTVQFGTPAVWFQAQATWHRSALPWDSLIAAWHAVIFAPSPLDAAISFMDPFFTLVLLGALGWGARRLPLSMTSYLAMIVVPPLFVVTTYSEHYPLIAMARYALTAFPFFLLLGALPKSGWQAPVAAFAFVLQTVWMMLFVSWVFVH